LIRVVAYIRVSSKAQADKGESLSTQLKDIEKYVKKQKGNGWKLIEVYVDAGISGASVEKQTDLKRLLADAEAKKFDIVIVHRLSRFGRNARELLNNVSHLDSKNIKFTCIKEQMDFSSPYGRAMLTMLAAIAELEREIIGEQTAENRIARAKQKIPTSGKLPIARKFNKTTGEWSLDEKKAELLRWAADEYLKGKSLKDIVQILRKRHDMDISYSHIHKIFTEKCGDKWGIKFKSEEEPISFKIPRILEDSTIQAIKDRIAFNRTFNRKDAKRKYLLSGYIRCGICRKALVGQHQFVNGKYHYTYYRHLDGKYRDCRAFSSIRTNKIEDAAFRTIFENVWDEVGFKRAVKNAFPDENVITNLKDKVSRHEKELKNINQQLDKLTEVVLEGTLRKETIKNKESDLIEKRNFILQEIENNKQKLSSIPSPESAMSNTEHLKNLLRGCFATEERLIEMTFEEKRQFLHWLFNGKNSKGTPYGIYIEKRGKSTWDYLIHAELINGLLTLKDNRTIITVGDNQMDEQDCFNEHDDNSLPPIRHDGPRYPELVEYWKNRIPSGRKNKFDYKTNIVSGGH
jgi:site-specific DNA recombinase